MLFLNILIDNKDATISKGLVMKALKDEFAQFIDMKHASNLAAEHFNVK